MSNTLLHHQIKGLALAQCPVFSLSMQIFLLSDSLSYPQRVSYYLTLFHTGLTYYFHDIGYPIIYNDLQVTICYISHKGRTKLFHMGLPQSSATV